VTLGIAAIGGRAINIGILGDLLLSRELLEMHLSLGMVIVGTLEHLGEGGGPLGVADFHSLRLLILAMLVGRTLPISGLLHGAIFLALGNVDAQAIGGRAIDVGLRSGRDGAIAPL